jgi:hypothetical protein
LATLQAISVSPPGITLERNVQDPIFATNIRELSTALFAEVGKNRKSVLELYENCSILVCVLIINKLEKTMQNSVNHISNEADVGSGEKGPGEQETDKMIEQVGDKVDETHQEKNQQGSKDKPAA